MNVFVLNTGRCGSTTFAEACKHMNNYSVGHESRSRLVGSTRLAYSEHHIEVDNRLSWMLGSLDKHYGDKAFYVHLVRDKEQTSFSFNRRWVWHGSIIRYYTAGVYMAKLKKLSQLEKLAYCMDYYDRVNDNIELFLKDKTHCLTVNLENIESDFSLFWAKIGAIGELDKALKVLGKKYNRSSLF